METKELTIIDQVKDVELKSGVAFELDITEVVSLAKRASEIKSVEDPNFLAIKKECQQKRKYVTEYFEDARKAFNAASKGVIQVQNMVLDEFTGEENRLIALDKAEKERLTKEARLEALPAKRERITEAGVEFTDEEILTMPDADFEIEFISRHTAKIDADRVIAEAKLAEERAAFEAEKAELARKQAEADAIENARKEERERAEEALRIQKETAEREKKEAEERRIAEEQERVLRAEREKKEAEERRIAEEQERVLRAEREKKEAEERTERERVDKEIAEEKRMADEKFQAFLKKNNHNDDTDIIIDGVNLYRFVAKFTD